MGVEGSGRDLDAAMRAWPEVSWARSAFAAHVEACVRGSGGRGGSGGSGRYLEDLYVAGAAGHRVGSAWEAIERTVGRDCQRVLVGQARADYSAEELWSQTRLRLMEDDEGAGAMLSDGRWPARIIRYRGQIRLLNYCIVIARRIAVSRQRRRRTMRVSPGGLGCAVDERDGEGVGGGLPADGRAVSPAEEAAEREVMGLLGRAVRKAYASLSSEQRFLLAMVYREGMKQKDAGAMLGWSEFKTSRQMSGAVKRMRSGLDSVSGVGWSGAMRDAWGEALSRCFDALQEMHGDASEGEPGVEGEELER